LLGGGTAALSGLYAYTRISSYIKFVLNARYFSGVLCMLIAVISTVIVGTSGDGNVESSTGDSEQRSATRFQEAKKLCLWLSE